MASTESNECPFCSRIEDGPLLEILGSAVAFEDGYPVSPGHTLVVPRRHVSGFYELSTEEQADVWKLVGAVRERLMAEHNADGINVGLNDGQAAGQTVLHAHVHIIPRYRGDQPDPRGGVRWVIPEKADYWSGCQGVGAPR